MSVPPIGDFSTAPAGFTPYVAPQVGDSAPVSLTPSSAPTSVSGPSAEFGDLLVDGLDRLEGLHDRADNLAVQAATGELDNIHDYTIAASESAVGTQLTVALRNKAIDAFNEIMRMQV